MSNRLTNKTHYLAYIFYSFVIIFLVFYITSLDYQTVLEQKLDYSIIAIASLVGVVAIYWGAFMWLFVLKSLGAADLNKRALFYVYGKAWLGRYIPGTAPWILGKIGFASKYGISKKKLAVSSILEAIFQIIATVLLSLLLIIISRKSISIPTFSWVILLLGIIGCVVIIQPKIFKYLVNRALKIINKQNIEIENQTSLMLNIKGIALYSVGALLTGFAMFLLANSISPLNTYSDMLYIMGASNLAAVIGMMAVFVPSGLGVREVTFVALLAVVVPLEQAVLISIISRFWSVGVDLSYYLISYLLYNVKNRNKLV